VSTEQTTPQLSENGASKEASDHAAMRRTLLWLSIAGASAAVTFFAVRAMMRREPIDPTSERIQALIDEANRLLRTLDDKKHE
jgi:type VI protein secretion system component VasF